MRREERFAVGELARVDVDISTGSVQVHSGPAGAVEVVVDAGGADQFEISQLGDTVTVRAPSGWFARGGKANVSLVVPHRTDMAVNVATAEVNLRGELGAVRVRSASSDITVEGASTGRGAQRLGRRAHRQPPARCRCRAPRATSASAP